jgi:hypothetical protein
MGTIGCSGCSATTPPDAYNYTWGPMEQTCGNSQNQFPWPNQVTTKCNASTVGWYMILSNSGSNCLGNNMGVTYDYEQCQQSCQ